MDYQLTVPAMMRRAYDLFGAKEIVSRLSDGRFHRYTYHDFVRRAKALAVALRDLGVRSGDRVGTLCWNHHQHLEAYFGVPAAEAVVNTLNQRLHEEDLAYIVNHAEDKIILVDRILLPLFGKFRERIRTQFVIVVSEGEKAPEGMLDYEEVLAGANESEFGYVNLDESQAAALCYTSGTTGSPKGVLYSHRAIALHSLAGAMADSLGIRESDVVMPVVPMFHANAWGLPFTCTLVGAKQVFPGPQLEPASLLANMEAERVTVSAAVPTVWWSVLRLLDNNRSAYDLSSVRALVCGGSAVPRGLIQAMEERHGLRIMQAWGMTEMTPLGTVARLGSELLEASTDEQYELRAKQGFPVPFVEIRARGDEGLAPWDAKSMGELEVRGPWIASSYYKNPESADRFTEDGWFRTGDIVTINPQGCVEIQDRSKDLIKSGGEWISSVAIENALMGHPAVAEAAVIAISHPTWMERPLAVVVLKEPGSTTAEQLRAYLEPLFAKWWLPDAIEFVDEIPRTTTGKFLKSALRERFRDYMASMKREEK